MESTLIFTHIPKTAGTSLKQSAIFPNVDLERVYWVHGFGKLIRDRPQNALVILGHFPYGAHRVLGRGAFRYLTILRDPVERAVSFYNYVLLCEKGNPGHPVGYRWHPALPDAKRYSIDEFYELEQYRNIQTKFTAGYFWTRPRTVAPDWFRRWVATEERLLERAKHNLLHRYWYFGLLERIGEAEETIARALGGVSTGERDVTRQTKGAHGIIQPTTAQRERIRQLNALDVALYDFALRHYDQQLVTPL